jgi:hypothetical protein
MLADITIQQSRLLTAYATQIPFVRAIENVAEIHPQILSEFEVGALPMWHDDEFAGEHCSLMHCLYTNRSGSLSSYQRRWRSYPKRSAPKHLL